MTPVGRALAAAAGLAVAAGVGCRRVPPGPVGGETNDGGAGLAEAEGSVAAVGPSRCRATDWKVRFFEDAGAADLELGDAVPLAEGVAVAMIHRTGGDRVAAVAFVRPDTDSAPRVVDLGPTLGDEPPPRVVARGGEVIASFHALPRGRGAGERTGTTRQLLVRAVTPDLAAPLFEVEEGRDDSLASDVAAAGDRGLLVWDEATSEAQPRGVISGVPFSGHDKPGGRVDLSGKESDAETPRAVAYGKGFAVAWIARAPDPQNPAADGSEPEVPGEPRTRGWVEMTLVDDHGAAVGPVRRLTPSAGHVTAFDLTVSSAQGPAAQPALLVVARDEGEAVDGSGGALVRMRVGQDSVEAAPPVAADGFGRGAPSFVDGLDGPAAFLSWVGPNEQLRLLALDPAGNPAGLPSAEEAMDDARPVLSLRPGRLLVETPADASRPLRTFLCNR